MKRTELRFLSSHFLLKYSIVCTRTLADFLVLRPSTEPHGSYSSFVKRKTFVLLSGPLLNKFAAPCAKLPGLDFFSTIKTNSTGTFFKGSRTVRTRIILSTILPPGRRTLFGRFLGLDSFCLVFYPHFSVLQNAIHESTKVFLFHGFFCKDYLNQKRVWFSLKSASRRDCEQHGANDSSLFLN